MPSTLDVISIGIGNGSKDKLLLQAICPSRTVRYCAVDVSTAMLDVALQNLANLPAEIMGISAFAEDLPKLKKYWRSPALICLLGNNFSNHEPDALLDLLASEMGPKDYLLFDCNLCFAQDGKELRWLRKVQEEYRSPVNIKFNVWPLIKHGMKEEDFSFELDIEPADTPLGPVYRTKKQVRILKNAKLSFGREKITFAHGDVIEMGFTYKYTSSQIAAFVWRHRFRVAQSCLSPDSSNLLMLVRKLAVRTDYADDSERD